MKVQVKTHSEYGVKKGGIVEVTKELPDAYIGLYDDQKGGKTLTTVRVKKDKCIIIEK